MPKVPTTPSGHAGKPIRRLREGLLNVRELSNSADHLGKLVRIVLGPGKGLAGTIVRVVTAEDTTLLREVGSRGTYYAVDVGEEVLTGLTWPELLKE